MRMQRRSVFVVLLSLAITSTGCASLAAAAQDQVDQVAFVCNWVMTLQKDLLEQLDMIRQAMNQAMGDSDAAATNPLFRLNEVISSLESISITLNIPNFFDIPQSHEDYEIMSIVVPYCLCQIDQAVGMARYQAKLLSGRPDDIYQNPSVHLLLYKAALAYCENVEFAMRLAGPFTQKHYVW